MSECTGTSKLHKLLLLQTHTREQDPESQRGPLRLLRTSHCLTSTWEQAHLHSKDEVHLYVRTQNGSILKLQSTDPSTSTVCVRKRKGRGVCIHTYACLETHPFGHFLNKWNRELGSEDRRESDGSLCAQSLSEVTFVRTF